jgi:uncharacterized membrane protein
MAEAAGERQMGRPATDTERDLVRAHASAADNVSAFFGEDIFIAVGSILVIRSFLLSQHIDVQPLSLSLWAIPTALAALVIHGARLLLLDRRLKRAATASAPPEASPP